MLGRESVGAGGINAVITDSAGTDEAGRTGATRLAAPGGCISSTASTALTNSPAVNGLDRTALRRSDFSRPGSSSAEWPENDDDGQVHAAAARALRTSSTPESPGMFWSVI